MHLDMRQILENRDDLSKTPAQWRMRETQWVALTRRFCDIITEYNEENDLSNQTGTCKKLLSIK